MNQKLHDHTYRGPTTAVSALLNHLTDNDGLLGVAPATGDPTRGPTTLHAPNDWYARWEGGGEEGGDGSCGPRWPAPSWSCRGSGRGEVERARAGVR